MIENILKLCREQPNDGKRGEEAAAAAVEKLAELWAEDPVPTMRRRVNHDIELLITRLRTLQNNIKTTLDLQSSLRHTGLTVQLEGDSDMSLAERWDHCLRRVRNMLAREEAIADVWCVNDVLDAAARMDVALNREDAQKALWYTEEHFRAQDGINWTVIEKAIEKVLAGDDDG